MSNMACQCPARKALVRIMAVLPAINPDFWRAVDAAKPALATTCHCEELRAESAHLLSVLESANAAAKRRGAERDRLRAELAAEREVRP